MKIKLKPIENYSSKELDEAFNFSPILKTYHDFALNNDPQLIQSQRHRAWVTASLAQIHQTSSTSDICTYWSAITRKIVSDLWNKEEGHENLALFALGKLGADELNLSSDIDLIIVSLSPPSKSDFKFIRQFNTQLTETTSGGTCYRTDYNLRPFGRLGPLICNISAFENYYWEQGATWERLALVRLSPICGNSEITNMVLDLRKRFCYRKFLDYRVIDDIQNIRKFIQTKVNTKKIGVENFDLKLGIGGIRDIELYIKALQVIHGGRSPQLQSNLTSKLLQVFIKDKILKKKDGLFLEKSYWSLRTLENLVQIKNDQQTHKYSPNMLRNLPPNRSIDLNSIDLERINQIVSTLLGKKEARKQLLPEGIDQQSDWLIENGFSKSIVHEIWPKIIKLTVLSKNSQFDEVLRSRFLFMFISEVSSNGLDLDLSLSLLYNFLKSIRPKSGFFHLLENEPNIVKELSIILSSSPFLGNLLSSRPEILDSFLTKKTQSIQHNTSQFLNDLSDFKLLNQLTISGQFLIQKKVNDLADACSETADVIAQKILLHLKKDFPNSSLEVIKLGKWGGGELGLQSDLDFIFVTENEINEDDLKVSRRFNRYLTSQQKGGELYQIDLRLRPQSGNSNLICTKGSLMKYIENDCKPWEQQAYLRATALNDKSFRKKILPLIFNKGLNSDGHEELMGIKKKLLDENQPKSKTDLNLKYSSGGLVDIELSIQALVLLKKWQNIESSTKNMLNTAYVETKNKAFKKIAKNYEQLRYYEQISQVLSQAQSTLLRPNNKNTARIEKFLKLHEGQLIESVQNLIEKNKQLLSEVC